MGSYLNPGSKGFQESLNSEIYVDKSGLIEKTNAVINTRQKFICVSRPRRFGKSMAADMLAAYYDRGEDTASLFDPLKISKTGSYQQHRNQYDVLKVNMQEFLSMTHSMDEMLTMLRHKFGTYWNQTETYEAMKIYIQMDMDGLQDAVVRMLAGERVKINTGTFSNDMTTFSCKDDVLTLLVHLGYLTYDSSSETVTIPNKEVSQEYVNAISTMNWKGVMDSVDASRKLLEALWAMDADAVAAGIDKAHEEVSILQYNDENSLSCTINLAFYFAREYYTLVRELPAGKGFADVCFIPRRLHQDKPAVVIELKWDKSASGALAQIKNKNYGDALKDYQGNLLLVGINYDKTTKKHECLIEKIQK